MNKKIFIYMIIASIFIVISFVVYKKVNDRRKQNQIEENLLIENKIEYSEKEANYIQNDEVKPEEIENIELNETNQILGCMILEEINNSGILTDEEMLKIVYNLINGEIIKVENNEISVKEVNDILYKMFNRQLSENSSIENMNYENDKYAIIKSSNDIGKIENDEFGVAMGSTYMKFEYNGEKYLAKFATNTVTGERFIQSITKR